MSQMMNAVDKDLGNIKMAAGCKTIGRCSSDCK